MRAEKVPPRSPSPSFVCSDLLPPNVQTSGLSLPGQADLARTLFPELAALLVPPRFWDAGCVSRTKCPQAPRALRHWDASEQAKVGGISRSSCWATGKASVVLSEVLTQSGNRNSDVGGHSGVEFGTKGGKLSLKEPQEQRQGWAGPFWELRLPSCKCPAEEGTPGARWAGTQLGTGKCCLHKPGHQEQPACQPDGHGQARGAAGKGTGCQTPLFLSKEPAEAGQSCLWLAPSLTRGMLALQHRGAGHTPASPHPWGSCWVGQPRAAGTARSGLQEQGCADLATAAV